MAETRGRHERSEPHPLVAQLREIRKARKMSQGAVAIRASVDRLTIWRWENGVHTPALAELAAYARVFDLGIGLVGERQRG